MKRARGNKSKAWFQKYVQTFLGRKRGIQLYRKTISVILFKYLENYALLLSKLLCSMMSGFRQTRCHDVLENTKDDRSITSKYSREIIYFKTPNVVIVFSNADPDMTQLSTDRWKVFYINKAGLSSQKSVSGNQDLKESDLFSTGDFLYIEMQLSLDIIKDIQINDRKIIWIIEKEGNDEKSWFHSYI